MINTILDIIYQYGWFFALFLLTGVLLYKFIAKNYEKWMEDSDKEKDDNIDDEKLLKHHTFFSNAQYRFQVEIPALDLIPGKPIREKVFKDLLQICFKNVYDIANEVINHDELNDWDPEQWVDMMTQAVNKIIIKTEEKAKLDGIPIPVIKKFLKWHMEAIESLHEHVLLLGNSKLYDTNLAKTNTLLLVMNLLLVTILGDAERVLREFNGELSGLNYKGLIIE